MLSSAEGERYSGGQHRCLFDKCLRSFVKCNDIFTTMVFSYHSFVYVRFVCLRMMISQRFCITLSLSLSLLCTGLHPSTSFQVRPPRIVQRVCVVLRIGSHPSGQWLQGGLVCKQRGSHNARLSFNSGMIEAARLAIMYIVLQHIFNDIFCE